MFKILNEVEKLYVSSLTECKVFLEAIYSKRLPNLGESMLVTIGDKIVRFSKIFKELLSGKTLIFMKILNTTIKAISIATIEIFLIGFKNKNFNFFFH